MTVIFYCSPWFTTHNRQPERRESCSHIWCIGLVVLPVVGQVWRLETSTSVHETTGHIRTLAKATQRGELDKPQCPVNHTCYTLTQPTTWLKPICNGPQRALTKFADINTQHAWISTIFVLFCTIIVINENKQNFKCLSQS